MNTDDQTLRDLILANKKALTRTAYVVMMVGVGLMTATDENAREEGRDLISAGVRIKYLLHGAGMTNQEVIDLYDAVNPIDEPLPAEAQA